MKKKYLVPLSLILLFCTCAMTPKEGNKQRNVLNQLGTSISKKYDLKFLNTGYGSLADAEQTFWALNFTSTQTFTIEQARPFLKELLFQVLKTTHHNQLFVDCCNQKPMYDNPPIILKEFVGLKIAFWDQNVNRPLSPFLAQIRFVDGKVYYHYADPHTQALLDPIVESLDDLNLPEY